MTNNDNQGVLDFSTSFFYTKQLEVKEPEPTTPAPAPEVKPEPKQKATAPRAANELPVLMLDKDFSTGEYTVWNTEECREVFRGDKEQAHKHLTQ